MAEVVEKKSITELLEETSRDAIGALQEFFRSGIDDAQGIAKARVAASTVSSYAKLKQAEGAQLATMIGLARDLAKDKEELQRFIKLTLPPGAPLHKALPKPTKED